MRVVAIGAGAWGKNIIRNLDELGVLAGIVEGNTERLNGYGEQYRALRCSRTGALRCNLRTATR